ncbi:3-alpha-hydroxysteroid dehydrogenase/carbonyl reductase [compost metagenome]
MRLNSIAPGATQTPLLQAGMQDERFSQAIRDYVSPQGRNAEPSEIAAAAAFLLSPQASFIHGAQLFVDGGIDAQTRPTRF